MKKILLLSVLFCLAVSATAQEPGCFNHLAIGVKAGTAGVGAELAAPIGPFFQVRAGYAMVPPVSINREVSVPEHPGNQGSDKGEWTVNAKATPNLSNAELLLDIFPMEHSGFHITAGMMYGPKNAVKVHGSNFPEDYNRAGLNVDDYLVKAQNGNIDGYIGLDALRPYLGVGFGRAVRTNRTVCVTCDLGAVYWGKPGLFAPGEDVFGDWEDVRITSGALNGRDEGLIDKAEKLVVYPMINVHVFFNLF
jgi:hypothetical protein